MKIKAIKAGFAISALALACSPTMATELRFDGFASFVAGQVLDKDELPEDGSFRGFDDSLGFTENSLFALQARADIQDGLSATAQIIAKGSEDYKAKFSWAYMTYEATDAITVKLGRLRVPYFMYSDFLDVGYAYHWISPPDAVYNLGGFDSADGVSVEWQTDIGNWISTLTVLGGRATTTLPGAIAGQGDAELDSDRSWLVAWNLNYDWLTLHAIHSESRNYINAATFNDLAFGLSNYGVSEEDISDLLLDGDPGHFDGVGISIDMGTYFAVAEYTESGTKNSFATENTKSWYVSGGVRFGDFTAYATAENRKGDGHPELEARINGTVEATAATTQFYLDNNFIPGTVEQVGASLLILNATSVTEGVSQIFDLAVVEQDTYSVGLRYNFHPSAALKVEYIQMDDQISDLKPAAVAVAVDLVY